MPCFGFSNVVKTFALDENQPFKFPQVLMHFTSGLFSKFFLLDNIHFSDPGWINRLHLLQSTKGIC